MADAPPPYLTYPHGAPIPDDDHSLTVGYDGPILLQDIALVRKLQMMDTERIPERFVHAKGSGFHGFFECTRACKDWTIAEFLDTAGKRTPVFTRFSTVAGERGSADTVRDPRGFSIKFYTEDGNYDMVGNNTPVFFINDGIKFADFIHSQKRDPKSNLRNPTMWYDFWQHRPESVHQVMWLMGPRGLPAGFQYMNGYSSHAFKFVNAKREHVWFKFHLKAELGVQCLSQADGDRIAGTDPDYHQRLMYNLLEQGGEAAWKVRVQIMTPAQARSLTWNPFDITLVWPHADFPLIDVGRMVLNRNPHNYFAEVEQSAFSPAHLVPGIEPSPDKMLQARLFSYLDTHIHRLGRNYDQIPINVPYRARVRKYGYRDGLMAIDGNGGSDGNYHPTALAPVPGRCERAVEQPVEITGPLVRGSRWSVQPHFDQAGRLWRNVFTDGDRTYCLGMLVATLGAVEKDSIKENVCRLFYKCDAGLGLKLAEGVGVSAEAAKQS